MLPLVLALTCACAEPARGAEPQARVRLGVEVLLEHRVEILRGKRVGLVTNPSGVDGDLVPTADRLAADPRVDLVRLFSPEHGIRGEAAAGAAVGDETDPVTGLPVTSLYGDTRRPTPAMLDDVDVLLFDIQDVGSRTYTYVSTLGEVMHGAAEAGKPVIVLDRPNPLGGELVEGPIREERWKSFISWGPVPVVHGMTAGELAKLFDAEMGIGCDVSVVPMEGWRRAMKWEDTGLTWTQTSPHVPHALHAHLYVATGMVGGVARNVNEGVGYTLPFETLAAEFLDPRAFAGAMNAERLPGVRFVPIAYTPFYGGFEDRPLRGARLVLTDRRAFRPLRTALTAMTVLERLHPGRVEYDTGRRFAIHWGNEGVLADVRAGKDAAEIEAGWADELREFERRRLRYLLYP